MQAVRFLVLPSNTAPWQHPGMIPSEAIVSGEQLNYIQSLVDWDPSSGYGMWHDVRTNEHGVKTVRRRGTPELINN